MKAQHGLERGDRHLVDPDGPGDRVATKPIDEIRLPENDPRLGSSQQLVPGEAHEVGAGLQGLRRCRLVERNLRRPAEQTAADVVEERNAGPVGQLR
jgi:hypothetical protein